MNSRRSFITGIKSTTLSVKEKKFLLQYKPWGVILFSRNIISLKQAKKLTDKIKKIFKDKNYPILIDQEGGRVNRLKKIAEWPKCIEVASLRLEPHRIPVYLYELSSEFHSYWNMGKDDSSKRFINDQKKIPNDKLVFLKVISNVIRSGMNIVGVDTPEKM